MTREQAYTEQMKLLGIYQPIFDPEIRTLCKLERDLQRLEKRWKAPPWSAAGAGLPPPTRRSTPSWPCVGRFSPTGTPSA